MTPRSSRTPVLGGVPGGALGAVVLALVVVLLSAALSAVVATPAEARHPTLAQEQDQDPDPAQDYPRMPRDCTPGSEKIPSAPVVCALDGFDAADPTIVLWGDSHAWMFIPALQAAAADRDVNLVAVVMGSCPPMDNAVKAGARVPDCYRSNALGVRAVRRLAAGGQPYRVILSGSWERYLLARRVGDRSTYIGRMAAAMQDGLPRLVRTLDSLGADVDVVAQVATVPERRGGCTAGEAPYACPVPRDRALPNVPATRAFVARTMRPVLGSRPTIDVTPHFCSARVCDGTVGSTLTWFDDLHLSASMSHELAPYFAPSVDAVAPPPPEPQEPTCTIPIICP